MKMFYIFLLANKFYDKDEHEFIPRQSKISPQQMHHLILFEQHVNLKLYNWCHLFCLLMGAVKQKKTLKASLILKDKLCKKKILEIQTKVRSQCHS